MTAKAPPGQRSLDDVYGVLSDIWWAIRQLSAPTLPADLRIPPPVVSVNLPAPVRVEPRFEVHPPALDTRDLLAAIGAIPDRLEAMRQVASEGTGFASGDEFMAKVAERMGQPPPGLLEAVELLKGIARMFEQQRQSTGRTLGLVPKAPATAADGSQTVTVQNAVLTTATAAPTVPQYGQKTVSVTNTAIQLSNQAVAAAVVQALAGNAGNVVVGDSAVTTANGFQLQPGQATGIAIDNLNRLYVNGTSGDGVCWIGS